MGCPQGRTLRTFCKFNHKQAQKACWHWAGARTLQMSRRPPATLLILRNASKSPKKLVCSRSFTLGLHIHDLGVLTAENSCCNQEHYQESLLVVLHLSRTAFPIHAVDHCLLGMCRLWALQWLFRICSETTKANRVSSLDKCG